MAKCVIECPHCAYKANVSKELVGKKTKCPKCQQVFTIEAAKTPEEVVASVTAANLQLQKRKQLLKSLLEAQLDLLRKYEYVSDWNINQFQEHLDVERLNKIDRFGKVDEELVAELNAAIEKEQAVLKKLSAVFCRAPGVMYPVLSEGNKQEIPADLNEDYLNNLLETHKFSREETERIHAQSKELLSNLGDCDDRRKSVLTRLTVKVAAVVAIFVLVIFCISSVTSCIAEQNERAENLRMNYLTLSSGGSVLEKCYFAGREPAVITILPGITKITAQAFAKTAPLYELRIPASVTEIEKGAFENCYIKYIEFDSDSPFSYDDDKKAVCRSHELVSYVAIKSRGGYIVRGNGEAVIPAGDTEIKDNAFQGCERLTSVFIPDSVTSIGENAFAGCEKLTDITISDSVTSIGGNAFGGCSGLENIIIPASVTDLGEAIFFRCTNLKSVILAGGMNKISKNMFWACEKLTNVTIPDGVTEIEEGAFRGCKNLSSVTIPASVISIGEHAFSGCDKLPKEILEKTVQAQPKSNSRYNQQRYVPRNSQRNRRWR